MCEALGWYYRSRFRFRHSIRFRCVDFGSNTKSVITGNIYEMVNYNRCRDSQPNWSIWFITSGRLSCALSVTMYLAITRLAEECLAPITYVHFHRWMFSAISSQRPAHIFRIKFVLLQPQFGWGRTAAHKYAHFNFVRRCHRKHVEHDLTKKKY